MSTSDRGREGVAAASLLLSLLGLLPGCVENALREGRTAMDYNPYPGQEDAVPTDGAIWAGSTPSGSFLFFDQKARGVGDLVTVLIVEDMRARGTATTALDSSRNVSGAITSDVGFASLISAPIRALLGLIGISGPGITVAEGEEVNVIASNMKNTYDGDGETERTGQFRGEMTCRVIDVLPGGLMHVRGRRYVVVNHEAQLVSIEGLVRREDIGIDNKVPSTALAEARITYDGLGVVDDKQRPGLLARMFDWAYPF
jgi:flagellar L-ring protein precursor FlgH